MLNFPTSNEWRVLSESAEPTAGHYERTSAMLVPGGFVLRVTTVKGDIIAESLVFVPAQVEGA